MYKNNTNQNIGKLQFSTFDYVLFVLSLLISVLIGIYYAIFGKKQTTMTDYLLAGRKMKVIPIAISIIATALTPTSLVALPSDIYRFGAIYCFSLPMKFVVIIYLAHVHLPVFFNSKVSTTYEYLEKRFDLRVRKFGSFLFGLGLIMHLPFLLLIPSLTLSTAIGLPIGVVALILCACCSFYTAFGGIKAVIWTDVFQFLILFTSIVTVFTCGIYNIGGFSKMWSKALNGQRLDIFDFDPDPTKRDSFWIISFGLFTIWLCEICVNQSIIIKFLSVPTYSEAKKSAYLLYFGFAFIQLLSILVGLTVYAKYSDCDPVMSKRIDKHDQIISFFVMDVAQNISGVPGIFVAGIVCSGLSSLSPDVNSLAGSIYEDFLGKYLQKKSISPGAFMKICVILLSLIILLFALFFQKINGLLPLLLSVRSITCGPLMGMFMLGTLFPKANNKGALYGGIVGFIFIFWLVVMSNVYSSFESKYQTKPLSVDGCDFNVTLIKHLEVSDSTTKPFILFRISFYYTALIGLLVTVISGLFISYFTNKNERPVDKDLLSPVIYFLLPKQSNLKVVNYETIQKVLDETNVDQPENEKL